MRLNRFLSTAGIASRRKADELILEGNVTVNGKVVTELGSKVDPSQDHVWVNGKEVARIAAQVYILLNKPKDCITTASDEKGRTTVMDYVKLNTRVYPVGRLDRNTTGVLLLTNDGDFAQLMTHPKFEIAKAYRVTLDKPLQAADGRALARGVDLADGPTGPAEVHIIPGGKNKVVGIVIREGRNRQVHRMLESLGYAVEKLDRVAYAGLTFEGLPRGRWRFLTNSEVARLRSQAAGT